MVATKSIQLPLNTKAYNFLLEDQLSLKMIELNLVKGSKATVIIFICNHCPYVLHMIDKFVVIVKKYQELGVECIAINANDPLQYPQDAPHLMPAFAQQYGITFPYVFDHTQQIAKQYQAQCTPDIFIYDQQLLLKYHGGFDESNPGNNKPVDGRLFTNALESILNNKELPAQGYPSIGCNIKWKNT